MPLPDMAWLLNDMASSRLAGMSDPSSYHARRNMPTDSVSTTLTAIQKVESEGAIAGLALEYETGGWDRS